MQIFLSESSKYPSINIFNEFRNTKFIFRLAKYSFTVSKKNLIFTIRKRFETIHLFDWLILFTNVEQYVHIDRGKPRFIHAIRAVSLLDWIIRYRSLGRGWFNLVFHREYVSSSVRFYPRRINLYKREVARAVSL